jgi:hypothetical protein
MPAGPNTVYFLKVDDKFQYVEDGVVKETTTPKPLAFNPDGWRNVSIQNVRNQKYFALDRSISVPLSFVEDGAQIIKHWNYKKGLRAKLTLYIGQQKLYFDATHYGYYYTYLFSGELDMSSFKRSGPKVTINIKEAGIPKYIQSNQDVKHEFPLNTDYIKVKLDGVRLRSTTTYSIIRSFAAQALGMKQILPSLKTTNEGPLFNLILQPEIGDLLNLANNTITGFNPATDERYWLTSAANNMQITVRVRGGIVGNTPTSSGNAGNEWKLQTNLGQEITIGTINTPFSGSNNPAVKFNISNTITLQKEERVFLYRESTTFNNSGFWSYDDTTEFIIEAVDRLAPTFIRAKRPESLYKSIISKVCESKFTGESITLQNYKNIVVTCGEAIRGIENPVIKTSLTDFFQSFNAVLNMALGDINGKVRMEAKTFFIDHLEPVELGDVVELEDSYANDYLINSLKIGYNSRTYDDVNGRQEFNNSNLYSTAAVGIAKELNLISTYRADCYGIEFLRLQTLGKDTTDTSSDNDVFIIHIKDNPSYDPVEGEYYEVDRSLNQYATGLLEPETVYNLWLSPAQCLLRHGPYIRSHFYKQDDDKLVYQTTEKNSDLKVSVPGADPIEEKADIEIGKLGVKYFDPIAFECKAMVSDDAADVLALHSFRSVTFRYSGIPFKALPLKAGFAPESKESQIFQMLSHPDNNLQLLEEVFD